MPPGFGWIFIHTNSSFIFHSIDGTYNTYAYQGDHLPTEPHLFLIDQLTLDAKSFLSALGHSCVHLMLCVIHALLQLTVGELT